MNEITFNPNKKVLVWKDIVYENVITITPRDRYYEVIVKHNDVNKPIFRFPISQTILKYEYND